MAPRLKVPKLEASAFKGWLFVVIAGSVLGIVALIDEHGGTGATGATGCTMTVLSEQLNVRSTPSSEQPPVGTLQRGQTVDALAVVTNGYRQLAGVNRWALNEGLAATAGSIC